MKRFSSFLLVLAALIGIVGAATAPSVEAYVSVKGYYRSNGTYVSPYVRSNPNALRYDNYSYKGSGSLYNSSYYSSGRSYSSSWYQPSYVTDSNYYTGKSLYESGSSYSPYNSYGLPSYRSSYSPYGSSLYGSSLWNY